MKNDVDRVRWAVNFVATDALKLTKRALLKLQSELGSFLGMTRRTTPGGPAVVVRPPYPWDYSTAQLFKLQREAERLLAGAVETGKVRGGNPLTISEEFLIDVVPVSPGQRLLRIGSSVQTSFLLNLAVLLAGEAGSDVRKCPECRRIFVRVRRQKYCGPKCTDRATWRAYPAEKKRRARQKQYDRQGWTLGARDPRKRTQKQIEERFTQPAEHIRVTLVPHATEEAVGDRPS